MCKNFSVDKCLPKHREAFLIRLCKLSELGFREMNQSHRHAYGFEKIEIKPLHFSTLKFISEEVEFPYAYRYKGKNPFLAYRRPSSAVLHIIAIGCDFSAYKHA